MLFKRMKVMVFVVVFEVLVGVGENSGVDYNTDESKSLCSVLVLAQGVLNHTKDRYTKDLRDAIYGTSEKNHQFDATGEVVGGGKCIFDNLRTQLCTYRINEGCYAQSLLGAFFCVCTPGGQKSTADTLCGTALKNYSGKGWWDQWQGGKHSELFEKVWTHVVEDCLRRENLKQTYAQRVEALGAAVKKVRTLSKKNREGQTFYSLGGNGDGVCSGTNVGSVCAAYAPRSTGGREADIPWADTIEAVVEILRQVGDDAQVVEPKKFAVSLGAENRNAMKPGVSPPSTVERERAKQENDKENDKKQAEAETTGGRSNSDGVKTRKRRSFPTSDKINIASLATEVNEDGYCLTKPKWLLLAALLN